MFFGWEEVYVHRAATANRAESNMNIRYRHTDECLMQLHEKAVLDSGGHYYASRDIYAYNSPGISEPYNCLLLYQNHLEYGPGEGIAQNAYTYCGYDGYGNVIHIFEHGDPLFDGHERTTTITYNPAKQPYIVGLPWQVTIGEGVNPVKKGLRYTYFCYNGDNGTDTVNCSGLPKRGLLTAIQAVDDKGLYITTKYQHDAYGNVQIISYPNNTGMEIWYDPTYQMYPTTIIRPLVPTTTLDWDYRLGLVKEQREFNQTTTHFYDALGRHESSTFSNGAELKHNYLNWGDPTRQATLAAGRRGDRPDNNISRKVSAVPVCAAAERWATAIICILASVGCRTAGHSTNRKPMKRYPPCITPLPRANGIIRSVLSIPATCDSSPAVRGIHAPPSGHLRTSLLGSIEPPSTR
jgi:hypothetical protein